MCGADPCFHGPMEITVTPDPELGGYVALDEETGVASQGDTKDEARTALTEALELYHDEPGGTPPSPRD